MTAPDEEVKKPGRGGKRVPKPGNHIGRPALAGAGAGTSRAIGFRVDPERDQKLMRIQAAFCDGSMSAVMLRVIDAYPDPGPSTASRPAMLSKDEVRAMRADPNVPEPSDLEVEFLLKTRGSPDARDARMAKDLIARYPVWAAKNGFC